MNVYTGATAAARRYVEAGRGRADDYFLAEGTGIARRYAAEAGRVTELAPLAGDGYERGSPAGTRTRDNRGGGYGPTTARCGSLRWWSTARSRGRSRRPLHPDVAEAHDAAQDRAAVQIIGWLSQHATTRVWPRGGQVQVPVEGQEAVTVRHYTSRAGNRTGTCICSPSSTGCEVHAPRSPIVSF